MTRRSKKQRGCALCKGHKHADQPPKVRQPISTLRKIGKSRKVTRHDLGDQGIGVTQPVPGQGKGLRAAAGWQRRDHRWEVEPQDERFATVVITDDDGGTLRYRVRRQPFGFHPTRKPD